MSDPQTTEYYCWAGFTDNKLGVTNNGDGRVSWDSMPSIWLRKKDARMFYEDVRKVKITVVK